ncbi:MAG: aminomethyltransferase family protein [Acidimicrobiales bacterium]
MSLQTAFHARIAELTGDWMDLFGYAAPAVVTDTLAEYRAVRETVGLMDFSMLRKLDVTGPGALTLLDALVTRDLTKVQPGHIAYGALVDERGKMVDDCTASVFSPDNVRFCGANDRDAEMFMAAAAGTEVAVRPFTDDMPHLCVQGPRSRDLLQSLTDRDLSNAAFPYYSFADGVPVAGIPVFMTRLGYTAELGYELWVERDRCEDLWDALVSAGAGFGMALIGMTALDVLRIEGGFIIGGVEYDPTVSPYECGLGWAVDFGKARLQGRDGLVRDREETTLRLTSVVLDDGGAEATGAQLYLRGGSEPVGVVTQAIRSPHLDDRTLGLAKLQRPHNAAGTEVVAVIEGTEVPGEAVSHPVYDPKRTRAKEKA